MSVSKTFFVDTNIFLYIFAQQETTHSIQSKGFLRSVREGEYKAIVSELILAEFIWTAKRSYGLPKSEIISIVRGIKDVCVVPDIVPDTNRAIDLFSKHSVKFIDALIASYDIVRNGPLPIVSYDKDFDKLGVERIEPGDLIA